MDAGFLVNGNPVRASLRERRNKFVWPFDHEMAIQRNFHHFAKRSHNGRAKGDVGNKMAVHNVDVQNGGSSIDGRMHLLAEPGEISGKNRGSQLEHVAAQLAALAWPVVIPNFWIT